MKNYLKLLILFFIITQIINSKSFAQIGGDNTYEFLNLSNSARIASMGSNFLTIKDDDITLALANPSLISNEMNNHFALSFVDYYSDINYGFASYSKTFPKIGSYVATMQYINYGTFDWTDHTGEKIGEFTAQEMALNIGWGRTLDSNFSIGANFKAIYSSFESYSSFGIAVDVAGTYYHPGSRFTASLIAKNIGLQLYSYNTGNSENLPFEIQLGISQKLSHTPFRYSILFTHLEKWDLTYPDQRIVTNNSEPFEDSDDEQTAVGDFADKFMRHIVIGGEVNIFKNFYVRAGYNYRRRQEMKVESKLSTVGFSWGFGFRISKFHFSYARSAYHLVGSPNYITITTNLSDFISKK